MRVMASWARVESVHKSQVGIGPDDFEAGVVVTAISASLDLFYGVLKYTTQKDRRQNLPRFNSRHHSLATESAKRAVTG
jgi:hypothetical protein